MFQGSWNGIAEAWLVWGWTVLAGPQGLLGAGVVGWSNSGSSTLGPLCVLPPASILSTESAQGHFSNLLCLIFFINPFGVFFFYWNEPTFCLLLCLYITWLPTSQVIPTLHIIPGTCLFGDYFYSCIWLIWSSTCKGLGSFKSYQLGNPVAGKCPSIMVSSSPLSWLHLNQVFTTSLLSRQGQEGLDDMGLGL